MKLLLTGKPRSGKTTLLGELLKLIDTKQGFLVREVRKDGERVSFDLVSADGHLATLASVESESPIRVSRYGVELDNFETFILDLPDPQPGILLYLDEIGQMELLSEHFKAFAQRYLDANNNYLGTLSSVYEDAFTRKVRLREDVLIVEVTPDNRDEVKAALLPLVHNLYKLSALPKKTQQAVLEQAKHYASAADYLRLKKLFNNAIKYLSEGRIDVAEDGTYPVRGDHGSYRVQLNEGAWSCECDLFNGKAEYEGNAGECSHILVAKLFIG